MSNKNVQDNQDPVEHFFQGAFSVDIVLITYYSGRLKILLQRKKEEPFYDRLGLPGRLILPAEDTDLAMDELMLSLLGTQDFYKKQLRAFSDVTRHPLGRVITFAFYGLIPFEKLKLPLNEDLEWHDYDQIPDLCYDHNDILSVVLRRFGKGLLRHPVVFELLPQEFILSDIISVYEQCFGKKLDGPNFRKQIKSSELVKPLGQYKRKLNNMGRPAEVYYFDRKMYHGQFKERIQFNF